MSVDPLMAHIDVSINCLWIDVFDPDCRIFIAVLLLFRVEIWSAATTPRLPLAPSMSLNSVDHASKGSKIQTMFSQSPNASLYFLDDAYSFRL